MRRASKGVIAERHLFRRSEEVAVKGYRSVGISQAETDYQRTYKKGWM